MIFKNRIAWLKATDWPTIQANPGFSNAKIPAFSSKGLASRWSSACKKDKGCNEGQATWVGGLNQQLCIYTYIYIYIHQAIVRFKNGGLKTFMIWYFTVQLKILSQTLHCFALHYYITLHYTCPFHSITLCYTTQHHITSHYIHESWQTLHPLHTVHTVHTLHIVAYIAYIIIISLLYTT